MMNQNVLLKIINYQKLLCLQGDVLHSVEVCSSPRHCDPFRHRLFFCFRPVPQDLLHELHWLHELQTPTELLNVDIPL